MMNATYRNLLGACQIVFRAHNKIQWKLNNIRRRKYRYSGLEFINQILASVDAPLLKESEHQGLINELLEDDALAKTYEQHLAYLHSRMAPDHEVRKITNWQDRFQYKNAMLLANANIFYILPRVLRPTVLVDTGVAAGEMTSFVLAALHKNQHGTLHSIDLKPQEGRGMGWTMEEDQEVGFLIPSEYKANWSLIMGDATYDLPRVFNELKEVDFFIHDSEHSFSHMMFEYSLGVKHVRKNGILISDDIYEADAFFPFFESMNYPIFCDEKNLNIGVVVTK